MKSTETLPPPSAGLGKAMVGIWRLVTREDHDSEGRRNIDPVLGPDPLGILSFAPGHFAAQFMKRERDSASIPTPVAARAEACDNNSGAVNGYDAYFGDYTIDERAGTITVRLEGALSPSDVGHVMTRDIRVAGDQLTIQLATTAFDGTPVTRRLVFQRLK